MSTCTNPKCRIYIKDGKMICPECGTPVTTLKMEKNRMSLERKIRAELDQSLPSGGDMPRHLPTKTNTSSSGGGEDPTPFSSLILALIFSALIFCIGCIPAQAKDTSRIESIVNLGSSTIVMTEEDSQTLTFEIEPGGYDESDIGISLSNPDILEVTTLAVTHIDDSSQITLRIKALSPGETTLTVKAKKGDAKSESINITVSEKIEVSEISEFSPRSLTLETGEDYETTLILKPAGLTEEDLLIESSDTDILNIDSISLSDQDDKSLLILNLTATSAGNAQVKVSSIDNEQEGSPSQTLSVVVEDPPKIEQISAFNPSSINLVTGEQKDISISLTPSGLLEEDITLKSNDASVVDCENRSIIDDGDESILSFTVVAKSEGEARVIIGAADGKTLSQVLRVTVTDPEPEPETEAEPETTVQASSGVVSENSTTMIEEDTSMTVYTNRYGDCYHYSASCASPKNPITTTLNKALAQGKRPCSKCVN